MLASTPNLAHELIIIHKVITRGLDVSLIKGREFLRAGFSTPSALTGYSRYTHSLVAVMNSHHMGEDLIAFPAWQKLIPSAPYARLASDHHLIENLLELIRPAINSLTINPQLELNAIVDSFFKISNIWASHYPLEEQYFNHENISMVMSLEAQRQLNEALTIYTQEHADPLYWIVPFVLYNLNLEDRASMAAYFPPAMIEEYIPKVWADQWGPMKPLLLV